MIVKASAPCRISLFGGGSDLPSFTKDNTGIAISMAINLRSEVTLFTKDDMTYLSLIPSGAKKKLYHHILKSLGYSMHSLNFDSSTEAIVGAGLGTSGASSAALIKALLKLQNIKATKDDIAGAAYLLESGLWTTGKQDIWAATFGGVNKFTFHQDWVMVEKLPDIENVYLFYIGGKRKNAQKELKSLTKQKERDLLKIVEIGKLALKHLDNSKYLGKLLDESWELKKKTNPSVSTKRIDKIYKIAKEAGAWGGKVCGAGGAGYMIFMTDNKEVLVNALAKIGVENIDYEIDHQGVEARIL